MEKKEFGGIIEEVKLVDVMNKMMEEKMKIKKKEWKEWGNKID